MPTALYAVSGECLLLTTIGFTFKNCMSYKPHAVLLSLCSLLCWCTECGAVSRLGRSVYDVSKFGAQKGMLLCLQQCHH